MEHLVRADLKREVDALVASGEYGSVDDVVHEGVRLLLSIRATQERRAAQLRSDIQVGLDQLDRGEGLDGEQVMRELRARLAGGPASE